MVFHKFACFLRRHGIVKKSCMLCAQYVSLRSNELMNNERMKIDNGLGELRLKRVETIADGHSLREKCPYSELFWSAFSRIRTEYLSVFSTSAEKCGPE